MPHPVLENRSPFAFEALFLADEEGRTLVVPVVKATFQLGPGGRLSLAEEQAAVNPAGTFWGEPGESSYRTEPETAFMKVATDCVLLGTARPDRAGARRVDVSFSIGPLEKTVRVHGDRVWEKGLLGARISEPEPLEEVPLAWERAFGGHDRSAPEVSDHEAWPANRHGMGYRRRGAKFLEGHPLPNLELPSAPLKRFHGRIPAATFGFTAPDSDSRVKLAGTYDASWEQERGPLLPRDFDRRFFSAATEGLVAPGYLRGDEEVRVRNVGAEPELAFQLPGVAPPRAKVSSRREGDSELDLLLDTVIVDMDQGTLTQLWRAPHALAHGAHDLAALVLSLTNYPEILASGGPRPTLD